MIRRLRGKVIERTPTQLVVDVGGVGYGATVASRFPTPHGADVDLVVYTQVRQDAIQLFGFSDHAERELFELLLTVPGIGPAKAMAILEAEPADLVTLVRKKDLARLARLPGIGKKTAERLVLDLFDKVAALSFAALAVATGSTPPIRAATQLEDLVSALQNLGFKPAQATQAAERVLSRTDDGTSFDILFREALQVLKQRTPS